MEHPVWSQADNPFKKHAHNTNALPGLSLCLDRLSEFTNVRVMVRTVRHRRERERERESLGGLRHSWNFKPGLHP